MTIIETPRLRLRPLLAGDAAILVRELNNIRISRNASRIPHPYGEADAAEFLAFANAPPPRSRVLAVERLSQPGQLIGVISYEWSQAKGDAELGYWYAEACWGQGFGAEAARALVAHAFTSGGHRRLAACFHDGNLPSERILTGLGFERVGACTSFSKAQNKTVPVTNLALSKARWQSLQNPALSPGCAGGASGARQDTP